ncbi:MAG: pseudouridine synthase, partial [Phycisphaeraceae bacterium]
GDGARAAARSLVRGGERVALAPPAAPDAAPRAQRMPLKVVYEDDDLVVIDKPAGLVVHPGAGQPDRTLMNALLAHAPRLAGVPRAGIVHRLDKDTTGLIAVAKTLEAQAGLVLDPGLMFRVTTITTLVTGTMFLMWLGEQITERGLGNGI